ncbi:unnamed protein product [Blepharisma stoltei]|uniref:Uncharacterized protein n=1 Tax=Blepharisma stoltei TaxID=1481888 RepID=A0AAU9KGP3_9CILI|nr:unnamed protein product [Blepharisma stoltei]
MKRSKISISHLEKPKIKKYNVINSILSNQNIFVLPYQESTTNDVCIQTNEACSYEKTEESPKSKGIEIIKLKPSEDMGNPLNCVSLSLNLRKIEQKISKKYFIEEKPSPSPSTESRIEYKNLMKVYQSSGNLPKQKSFLYNASTSEASQSLASSEHNSPLKPSAYPKVQLSKELLEYKSLADAYQNISDLPKLKIDKERPKTSLSHQRRKSCSDKSVLGLQYKYFASNIGKEKKSAKCNKCNSIYCVCHDRINDNLCLNFIKEHQKQVNKCEEIKQEIGFLQKEFQSFQRQKGSVSSSFFIGENNESFESPRKNLYKNKISHRRIATAGEKGEKSIESLGRKMKQIRLENRRRNSNSKSSVSLNSPGIVVSQIDTSALKCKVRS